ncbi:MAG: hypothetical protein M1834_004893 [Cirrosporium novae-zelandiae]|nr:MAG: hypothetical protein M1834_004893 [Cirrosporium novae-zelandiae]
MTWTRCTEPLGPERTTALLGGYVAYIQDFGSKLRSEPMNCLLRLLHLLFGQSSPATYRATISGHKGATSPSQLFREPEWLGFRHDGYEVMPLDQCLAIRRGNDPSSRTEPVETRRKELAASTWSFLKFGPLEAVPEEHVPKSVLVRKNGNERLVMSKTGLLKIVQDWIDQIKRRPEDVLEP